MRARTPLVCRGCRPRMLCLLLPCHPLAHTPQFPLFHTPAKLMHRLRKKKVTLLIKHRHHHRLLSRYQQNMSLTRSIPRLSSTPLCPLSHQIHRHLSLFRRPHPRLFFPTRLTLLWWSARMTATRLRLVYRLMSDQELTRTTKPPASPYLFLHHLHHLLRTPPPRRPLQPLTPLSPCLSRLY